MNDFQAGVFAIILGLLLVKYPQWCTVFDVKEVMEKGLQPNKDKLENIVVRIGGILFIMVGLFCLFDDLL